MAEYIAIKTKHGQTIIELFRDKAPNHVQRIIELANERFYNGIKFHRVIDGFMVQGGCPKGNGTSGSDKPNLKAEFNDIQHEKGVMSMARAHDPNSANSQFFIMLGSAPHLDRQYTAFGKVVSGMEYIHMIRKDTGNNNGIVSNPDSIDEMYVCDIDGKSVTQSDL